VLRRSHSRQKCVVSSSSLPSSAALIRLGTEHIDSMTTPAVSPSRSVHTARGPRPECFRPEPFRSALPLSDECTVSLVPSDAVITAPWPDTSVLCLALP